uniref:Uncharacterized protein n=1 Tax=Anopheles dirus TaxID=7168 RepID=A0A182NM16_9DIPT
MNQTADSADIPAPVEKKSHRIQVSLLKCSARPVWPDLKRAESHAEQGKTPPTEEISQPNFCEPQQVGILRGLSEYTKPYRNSDDILKHLAVVYLYTILKSPPKWTPETFNEVVELEATIAKTKLEARLPILRNGKTYNIHLSNTLVKGRFVTPSDQTGPARLDIHQALARMKRGKAAIWKCDTYLFLIRRLLIGWHFYTMNLQEKPALMFFSCPQLMVELVQESYGCTERSKYFLSNIVLHSVQEDDTTRVVWKMKRSVGMKLISPLEAVLHGNICLERPSLERSLEIGLNVVRRARDLQTRVRSWDNKVLNGCFKRNLQPMKAIKKIASFVRDPNEKFCAIGNYKLGGRSKPFGHRQRKHFEELVSYFLTGCSALLVVGLDCCLLLWTRNRFLFWFSPYRYSALEERPESVQNRACFLHMTNALAKVSQSVYEYLYEVGVFPDHTIELIPMRMYENANLLPIPCDADEDSLDDESLTIPPASEEQGWTSFYSPALHTPSELRLARQMLDVVRRTAEDRCE